MIVVMMMMIQMMMLSLETGERRRSQWIWKCSTFFNKIYNIINIINISLIKIYHNNNIHNIINIIINDQYSNLTSTINTVTYP